MVPTCYSPGHERVAFYRIDRRCCLQSLKEPLAKALVHLTFTPEQQSAVINLCAKCCLVFSLSRKELGKFNAADATFPFRPTPNLVDAPGTEQAFAVQPSPISVCETCSMVTSLRSPSVYRDLSPPLLQARMANLGPVSIIATTSTDTSSAKCGHNLGE